MKEKLKQVLKQLADLQKEGDGLIAKAEKESRELTDQEAERLSAIQEECKPLEEQQKELEGKLATIEGHKKRRTQLSRFPNPAEVPTEEEQQLPEDRTEYNAWPLEEAWQWLWMARAHQRGAPIRQQMGSSVLHEQLCETFTGALEGHATGQNTIIDDEGGFLVPSTIQQLVLQHMFEEGSLLSRVTQVPITVGNSTKWNVLSEWDRSASGGKGSRYAGIVISRTGEGVAAQLSKIHTERVQLELKKMTAFVGFTEEQQLDGPQMVSILTNGLPRAFRGETEGELFSGNGAAEMQGIMNSPSKVVVAAEAGQAAGTISYENVSAMWSRLPSWLRSDAVWLVNQDAESQLERMVIPVGTGGWPVYMPPGGISGASFGSIKGRPVIVHENGEATGTEGDIVLFAPSQYLYGFKGGLVTAQSIHVKFLEGETVIRAMMRNDGKVWWSQKVTAKKGGTTRGPIITLATRS